MIEIKVQGLAELRNALARLPQNVGRNALRGAVNAGAKAIADEVRDRSPVDTGTLRRAVYRKQIRELSGPVRQTFFVGVRHGKRYQNVKAGKKTVNMDAWYWRFIEFGTRRMPARPFLRPAFDAQKMAAIEAIRAYLARRIPLEAAKLRGKP
jgi:HK97 gp10 family phage protein